MKRKGTGFVHGFEKELEGEPGGRLIVDAAPRRQSISSWRHLSDDRAKVTLVSTRTYKQADDRRRQKRREAPSVPPSQCRARGPVVQGKKRRKEELERTRPQGN